VTEPRISHEAAVKTRIRAENRLLILGLAFVFGFGAIGTKMAYLANTAPAEPKEYVAGSQIVNQRADIIDRNGNVLATNMSTKALYAQPPLMVDPKKAADDLHLIFPDLDHKRLVRDFTSGKRKFIWVKKRLSPEQRQRVHDLGEPGLLFGNREMRLYPNGKLAAHILGGTRFGEEGVRAAEVIGVGGVEKYFDDMLRDPSLEGSPLQLSIDLTAQSACRWCPCLISTQMIAPVLRCLVIHPTARCSTARPKGATSWGPHSRFLPPRCLWTKVWRTPTQ